jgi:hypothetical protein
VPGSGKVLPVPGTEKSANPRIFKMGLKGVVTGIIFEGALFTCN